MNLPFFFDRLEKNKKIFTPFIIQMIIVFLILPNSLLTSVNTISGISRLKKLEINNAYIMEDYTTDATLSELLRNREEAEKRFKDLFLQLNEQGKRGYGVVQSSVVAELCGVSYSPVCTNDIFFDINKMTLSEGAFFDGKSNSAIRVVLGNAFKNIVKVGDNYTFCATNGKALNMTVTGILNSKTTYPKKDDPKTMINADNCIFINISDLITCGLADVPTFDVYFFNYIVLDENDETIHEVWDIFDSSKTKTLFPRKYNEFLQDYSTDGKQVLGFQLICSLIITVFSVINMLSCIYVMIERNMKEFAINIICGAQRKDLFFIFALQFIFVMIWPVLLNLCIFKDFKALAISILIAIILSLICLSVPLYKIGKIPISNIIRRCE